MKKLIHKVIILSVVSALLFIQPAAMLTGFGEQPANLTNRYFYGVSQANLYPTASLLSPWGWTGVSYTSLAGGGTNISYSNFGSSIYCVGINKTVKFDGLDLMLNIDTTKATAANDQYFYVNFCNGLQQNFWTNPFAIRINRTIGQVVLYCNGGIIGVLDNRPEIKNTTTVRIQTIKIEGVHYVVVNGLNFGVSDAQLASCNNFSNLDATYVTISPAENNTNFSLDILYLRGGEGVDCDDVMANVPAEQIQVTNAASTIDLINAIGTVTVDSEPAITAARNKYDALGTYNGASFKPMVFNIDTLIAAEKAYSDIVTGHHQELVVIQMIDDLGTITVNSGDAITAAETAYLALDPDQKPKVLNYQTLVDARATYRQLKVIKMIDDLGVITANSGDAILAAETAYLALDTANQALVSNYQTLLDARATYQPLAVIKMIDSLGTITAASGTAIADAEAAYMALSSVGKTHVTNHQKLLDARAEFISLLKVTDRFFYGIDSGKLFPTNEIKASWGNWTGVSYADITGGGVNLSYSNFGSPDYCVGINKVVKFNGLHFELQVNTAKATTENDQYFYMNFCNGLQQSIATNPFSIRYNRIIGQVVLYAGGNIIGVLDRRPEVMNTTKVTVQITLNPSGTDYNVAVNGLNFNVLASQLASCTNFGNPDATYVTVSPAIGGTNCSIDILSLHGGETPCIDTAPAEDKPLIMSVDMVTKLISKIGTVTSASGEKIAAARSLYDALLIYKPLVNNVNVLTDAEAVYNKIITDNQRAAIVMQIIENLGVITEKSDSKITAAEDSYLDLFPRQRRLVTNYQTLVNARAQYDLLVPPVEETIETPSRPDTGERENNIILLIIAISAGAILVLSRFRKVDQA